MEEFLIRRMVVDDIDAVHAVECQSFLTPWSRTAFEEEMIYNELARYLVVVANCEGLSKIVGYAGMWIIVDEAHVTNIAISPGHRRCGLGHRLLEELIKQAKCQGANCMTLEVRPSNIVARRLYERRGFVERGIRPNYYTDTQEDALIMWLDKL
ncbi:MAG TPA: ribosomal protein S18-alanine N-acetyltransferase [Methylomusa anaerophila]|uniref:[Ribosomal protein bS18]-alanine N-acetyltransferase n=2 Tax=Methylomusa anaerophila TaxID=1930071 RepID=A0A348AMK3_9FIRM|nr:ribosomal protein S18-alanine N-acetyltransferase [Methylomusa anaerophila]BBB92301.1 phosphinothricin N-acetyltransferase [Methylomusa anaerophila]HML90238.1 ribosomal protein S18-alanine N-acetyltransferase [Methylomusa anaerophila]